MSILSTLSSLVQNLLGNKPAQSTPVAPSTGGNYQVSAAPAGGNYQTPPAPVDLSQPAAQPLFVNLSAPATASPVMGVVDPGVAQAQADTFREEQANAPKLSDLWSDTVERVAGLKKGGRSSVYEQQQAAREFETRAQDTTRVRGSAATGFEAMEDAAYQELSEPERMAVQWNTLLQSATDLDRELLNATENPVNEGQLTLGGVGYKSAPRDVLDRDSPGYREAYESIFGAPTEGEPRELVYAPNTVGLLSQLGVTDANGTLENYLSGQAAVKQEDLRYIRDGIVNSDRRAWLGGLVGATSELERVLEQGRVMLNNVGVNVSLESSTTAGKQALVGQLAGMSLTPGEFNSKYGMTGEGDLYDSKNGLDVSGLISNQDYSNTALLNQYFDAFAQTPGVTPEMLLDLESMEATFAAGGTTGVNMRQWEELVKNRFGMGETDRAKLERLGIGSGVG